jgi:hypothetical protein
MSGMPYLWPSLLQRKDPMVEQNKRRSSGRTTAQENTAEVSLSVLEPAGGPNDKMSDMERTVIRFRSPGFAGLSLNWTRENNNVLARARALAQQWLDQNYGDVLRMMNEIFDIVREKQTDAVGEILLDANGFPIWKTNKYGRPIEDWGKLTRAQRDTYLFSIVTNLFMWRQRAADAWLEAMAAKAQWDEAYSGHFESLVSGTIEDREAHGKVQAQEERMFAILLEYRRRLADALIKDMDQMARTLMDSLRTS